MELASNATDRETMTNTFLQQYMQNFVEKNTFEDGMPVNPEEVIREAIRMHQQVRSPAHALLVFTH